MDIRRFFIKPQIPSKLNELEILSQNIWAFWDKDAEKLFHRLDPKLFRHLNHNPVELLFRMDSKRLNEASKDKGFLNELRRVYDKFDSYMGFEGTYAYGEEDKPFSPDDTIVYTCMEYGLHESLPFYSGGLAVLAGDYLKAASDVGLPVVSFGLLYRYGYFNQRIASGGRQMEEFNECNWYVTPVREVVKGDGLPVYLEIPIRDEKVLAKLWNIRVGKTTLYLIDANIHQNPEKFRKITHALYDADQRIRLEQELLLGRGSIIALRTLGINPKVYHINEGHTAFSILERLLNLMKVKKLSFDEGRALIKASTVFTTHTPVIEGNEHYPEALIKEYLEKEAKALGMTADEFLSMGKVGQDKFFWLPAFAFRFARISNAVSKVHNVVSRKMWQGMFHFLHINELPITTITNGVHLQSWLSLQISELFDRYIGPEYLHKADSTDVWKKINEIPDDEIWNAHCRRKEQVISFVRRKVGEMLNRRGYGNGNIVDITNILNPSYLTIGFARRFAAYKRANLVLNNPERFAKILKNDENPVQIIFAGKAHPANEEGKKMIESIFKFIEDYSLEDRVVFLEDYDINIARHLVQGVDLWLNTPERPMEASGTSGMKAGINGVLNLSVGDGWWPEAYDGENGWIITAGGKIVDPQLSTAEEANQLYNLLEYEVVKKFYKTSEGGIPVEWARMMKNSIITVCGKFNMHRVLREYLHGLYLPQIRITDRISENDYERLKAIVNQKKEIEAVWPKVYLKDYFTSINGKTPVSGKEIGIDCYAYLGEVSEKLIGAEVIYCYGEEGQYEKISLDYIEKYEDRVAKYSGKVVLQGTGQQEIGVRLVPAFAELRELYPEYVKWRRES